MLELDKLSVIKPPTRVGFPTPDTGDKKLKLCLVAPTGIRTARFTPNPLNDGKPGC